MSSVDYRGLVSGHEMFAVSGPLREASREVLRYAHQYAEEGEVVTQMKIDGRWKTVNILETAMTDRKQDIVERDRIAASLLPLAMEFALKGYGHFCPPVYERATHDAYEAADAFLAYSAPPCPSAPGSVE